MPSLYPQYACQVCNCEHDLYYSGREFAGPNLGHPYYYSCPKLPGPMRLTAGDRWHRVRTKPEGAVEIYRDDAESQKEKPGFAGGA